MDENPQIELETKIAHQEYLLAKLNDVVVNQQTQITELQSLYKSLLERFLSFSDSASEPSIDDERPPHY